MLNSSIRVILKRNNNIRNKLASWKSEFNNTINIYRNARALALPSQVKTLLNQWWINAENEESAARFHVPSCRYAIKGVH